MIYWNGIQSTTSIVVVVRTETAGNCTLTIGNTVDTAYGDPAVADGLVRLEVTGLASDTQYAYTVANPDESGTGKNTTFPTSGSAPIGMMGCQGTHWAASLRAMRQNRVYAVVHFGDESYDEDDFFSASQANFQDQDLHYQYRREFRTDADKIREIREIGFCWQTDDHDAGINDCADDLAYIQGIQTIQGWSFTTPDQSSWDATKVSMFAANNAYTLGNPINTDSDSHGGGDGSARYYRFEAGDVEYFVLAQCLITNDIMRGKPDNLLQPHALLGDDGIQAAWLWNHVKTSRKSLKMVISQKATLYNRDVNGDSWRSYNDLYDLLQDLSDDPDVTGLGFASNDNHIPGVYCSKAGSYGVLNYTPLNESGASRVPPVTTVYDFDHVSVLCGPSGKSKDMRNSDIDDDGPKVTKPAVPVTSANAGTLFWVGRETSIYSPDRTSQWISSNKFRQYDLLVYGIADSNPDGDLQISIMQTFDQTPLFSAVVEAGTNFVKGT